MTEPALFQFEPLQDDTAQIRLLQVAGDGTYCLQSFDVDDCPPYTALSYTWGPPSPTTDIYANGQLLTIRDNLWLFLQQLRSGITVLGEVDEHISLPEYLWIDQICIDQASSSEKSHQVQRMDQIFEQAQLVIVWLGPGDDDTDTVIN